MPAYIALLRGINVGGTGILAMKDLASLCERVGFTKVRTYIQSGNVLFESASKEDAVQHALEDALRKKMGKSKVPLSGASATVRNLNTVARLTELAEK